MAVIESTEKRNFIHMLKLTFETAHGSQTSTHTTKKWITGYVDRVVVVPSAIATPPKSGFTFTLTDNDEVDILKGGGSACSATLTTDLYPDYSLNSDLDMVIGAVGTNGAHGYAKVFWREGDV